VPHDWRSVWLEQTLALLLLSVASLR